MEPKDRGGKPRRRNDEQLDAAVGPLTRDPTLLALADLVRTAEQVSAMLTHVTDQAAYIRRRRLEGTLYREIVDSEDVPLIAALLTENIRCLETAGTRFRQAEARALHEEGMTMEEIGRLFGLTRQRISALIRVAPATSPSPADDDDAAPTSSTDPRDPSDKSGQSSP